MDKDTIVFLTFMFGAVITVGTCFGLVPYNKGIHSGFNDAVIESIDDPEKFQKRQELEKAKRTVEAHRLNVEGK